MKNIRIDHKTLPEPLVHALADRDAALWIGEGLDDSEEAIESLRQLIGLPWKLVLCELSSASLYGAIGSLNTTGNNLDRRRGWREVLDILQAMPAGVRETSRTFNHHIAISLPCDVFW